MRVAGAGELQPEAAVAGDLVEHMVEEADARVDLTHRRRRIEIDLDGDARFLGIAGEARAAGGCGGVDDAEHRQQRRILRLGPDRDPHPAGGGIGAEADLDRGSGEATREILGVGDDEEQVIAAFVERFDLIDAAQPLRQHRAVGEQALDAGAVQRHPFGRQRGLRGLDRGLGQRIGRRHARQPVDDRRIRDRAADPRARQSVSLGQRAQHDEIGDGPDLARQAGIAREFAIGLVGDHQRVGQRRGDVAHDLRSDGGAGRVVGRAEIEQFGRRTVAAGCQHRLGIECEIRPQLCRVDRCALDARELRVGRKGRQHDDDAVLARTQECAGQKVDRIVAAAAHPQLVGADPVKIGHALAQRGRLRLGIAVDRLAARQRLERILVGVEPDRAGHRRAREIDGRQVEKVGAHETAREIGGAHSAGSVKGAARRSAARACASSPSSRASVAATGARRCAAASSIVWKLTAFMKLCTVIPPV